MPEETLSKTTRAIAKLTRLTREEALEWETVDPPEYVEKHGEKATAEVAFQAVYKDTRFLLYEVRFMTRYYTAAPTGRPSVDRDNVFEDWETKHVLEVVDEGGRPLFEFPDSSVVTDLLEAAKYQVGEVDSLLDDILGEGE